MVSSQASRLIYTFPNGWFLNNLSIEIACTYPTISTENTAIIHNYRYRQYIVMTTVMCINRSTKNNPLTMYMGLLPTIILIMTTSD